MLAPDGRTKFVSQFVRCEDGSYSLTEEHWELAAWLRPAAILVWRRRRRIVPVAACIIANRQTVFNFEMETVILVLK